MAKAKKTDGNTIGMFTEEGGMPMDLVEFAGEKTRIATLSPMPLLGDYRLVNDEATLAHLSKCLDVANRKGELVAWDTEFHGASVAKGLNPHLPQVEVVGISIACRTVAWYIPIGHRQCPVRQLALGDVSTTLGPRLQQSKLVAHNWKIDAHIGYYNGFGLLPCYMDTYTAAHFLRPMIEGHQEGYFLKGLKKLAKAELGIDTLTLDEVMERAEQNLKKNGDVRLAHVDDMMRYACHDAMQTLMLANHFEAMIRGTSMEPLFFRIFMPLLPVLAKLERRGLRINLEYLRAMMAGYARDIEKHDATIEKLIGYNPTKPADVTALLYETWHLPEIARTRTGQPSLDEDTLTELGAIIIERGIDVKLRSAVLHAIQKRAKLKKLISTYNLEQHVVREEYIDGVDYGIVHTEINECGAASGRQSSNNPNGQNMPKNHDSSDDDANDAVKIRSAIAAPPGYKIVVGDLSQIEPRGGALVTYLLGDPTLRNSYKAGRDIYKTMGAPTVGLSYDEIVGAYRDAAKVMVLAVFYGMGPGSIATHKKTKVLGKNNKPPTKQDAQAAFDNLYSGIPGLKMYQWNAVAWALYQGYAETIWGFRTPCPDLWTKEANWPQRRAAESRTVRNQKIQGWACSFLEAATIWIDQIVEHFDLAEKIGLMLTVHDEDDWLVADQYIELCLGIKDHCMSNLVDLPVPIKSDSEVGQDWGSVIEWKDWKGKPSQVPETAAILAEVRQMQSPFWDFPLAPSMQPFDMSWVSDDDLPLYCWHAADLKVAIGDKRLPMLDVLSPRGMVVGANEVKRTKKQLDDGKKNYHRAQMVCQDGNISLISFDGPISEGLQQCFGVYDPKWGSFRVQQHIAIGPTVDYRKALAKGEVVVTPQGTWRFDKLKEHIAQ